MRMQLNNRVRKQFIRRQMIIKNKYSTLVIIISLSRLWLNYWGQLLQKKVVQLFPSSNSRKNETSQSKLKKKRRIKRLCNKRWLIIPIRKQITSMKMQILVGVFNRVVNGKIRLGIKLLRKLRNQHKQPRVVLCLSWY